MKASIYNADKLLSLIRNGGEMTFRMQIRLVALLSVPAILAQISSIIMQYIDASMVGHLGASEAASIGLVSTSIWLLWGLGNAVASGFAVQVAHRIGADDVVGARSVLRQSITFSLAFSLFIAGIGVAISGYLPVWLGGNDEIVGNASLYFLVFSLSLPLLQISCLAGSMLRCSGNMRVPSMLNVMMCVLDVIFNFLLIFETRDISFFGVNFTIPGAGLGVLGAALGTTIAEGVTAGLMVWFLCFRSKDLRLTSEKGSFLPTWKCLRRAAGIGAPMGGQHFVMCGAHILITAIVAPLGTFAIAANSFAITAESLCYMPGYGIAEAATTLVGQCIGAIRKDLARRFAHITVASGVAVMAVMGIVMYVAAPLMMEIMTSHPDVQELGATVLRIEAFAEPMFAASIVAYGVFVGAGDTLIPCTMNLASIWAVRLTLAFILAPIMGLRGVWLAMCIELCFRGAIFLWRLKFGNWLRNIPATGKI